MFTERGRKTQKLVYDFIRSWSEKHSYPPSIREICQGVGLASTKAAKYHVDALVDSGLLRRNPRRARSIELTAPARSLPLVGRIAAGQPILAIENVEAHVALDRFRDCFLLRVKGDSMTDAGILDSDLAIVQPQEFARDGEIVAALVGNEATIKRFFHRGSEIALRPENPSYEPILLTPGGQEFRIVGRVVGILRSYQ